MQSPVFQPDIFVQSLRCDPQCFTSSGSQRSANRCSEAWHCVSGFSLSMHEAACSLHVVPVSQALNTSHFPAMHFESVLSLQFQAPFVQVPSSFSVPVGSHEAVCMLHVVPGLQVLNDSHFPAMHFESVFALQFQAPFVQVPSSFSVPVGSHEAVCILHVVPGLQVLNDSHFPAMHFESVFASQFQSPSVHGVESTRSGGVSPDVFDSSHPTANSIVAASESQYNL